MRHVKKLEYLDLSTQNTLKYVIVNSHRSEEFRGNMAERVTIKDVARHAGISYQTVSRVINDKPDVAPETRKRVLEAIDVLNYRPSMAATSRANPKTHIMAVAISPYNEYLL